MNEGMKISSLSLWQCHTHHLVKGGDKHAQRCIQRPNDVKFDVIIGVQ